MNEFLSAALHYASRGWFVLPLTPGAKAPPLVRPSEASKDPEQIRAWWTQYPTANVGVRTGPESDLQVLDIDDVDEDVRGLIYSLLGFGYMDVAKTPTGVHVYLSPAHPSIPKELTVLSPRGGFFTLPVSEISSSQQYVMAPPSRNGLAEYLWLSVGGWLQREEDLELLLRSRTAEVQMWKGLYNLATRREVGQTERLARMWEALKPPASGGSIEESVQRAIQLLVGSAELGLEDAVRLVLMELGLTRQERDSLEAELLRSLDPKLAPDPKAFYLAGSSKDIPRAQALCDQIEALGYRNTEKWWVHIENSGGKANEGLTEEIRQEARDKCCAGVDNASFVVLLEPPEGVTTIGAWWEAGWARDKPVHYIGTRPMQTVFTASGRNVRVWTPEMFLEHLRQGVVE